MIAVDVFSWHKAPTASPNRTLFAIGDVHGHAAHLEALHTYIRQRIKEAYDPRDVTVVWLGDYVDRGPDPYEALALVNAGIGVPGVKEVRLIGNHEEMMLQVIRGEDNHDDEVTRMWMLNGGRDTITSICGPRSPDRGSALASALKEGLGQKLLGMLDRLTVAHREENYFFVHAGVDPRLSLSRQNEDQFLWMREPFLTGTDWRHDFVVVHGHTPATPIMLSHRIGADSGCYMTGRLTAVEIAGDQARFVQATY